MPQLSGAGMMTFRCTQKLLRRLPLTNEQQQVLGQEHFPAPDAALGDWFATLLFTRPAHLVLCVSETSRLCVVLPAREPKHLLARFEQALDDMLDHIAVSKAAKLHEKAQRQQILIGPTTGKPHTRSILGSLNEYTRLLTWELQHRHTRVDERGLLELGLYLNGVPCGPLQGQLPEEVARRLVQQQFAKTALPPTSAPFVFKPRLVQ